MRILVFGASGMVGEGVLRYLLQAQEVTEVVAVTRKALRDQDAKLRAVVLTDLFDTSAAAELTGFDACLWCLGVSSVGMDEAAYRHVTQELTLKWAAALLPGNPAMVFEYISGEGTNTHGKRMWERVKGETEDAICGFGFRDAYALRPGFIERQRGLPVLKGWVAVLYKAARPFLPLLRRLPAGVTSTDQIAQAMLRLASEGSAAKVLNSAAINRCAAQL